MKYNKLKWETKCRGKIDPAQKQAVKINVIKLIYLNDDPLCYGADGRLIIFTDYHPQPLAVCGGLSRWLPATNTGGAL